MNDEAWAVDNARNHNQGMYKHVLCICSAGLLRSPTAAWILSQPPYQYNTRACGVEDYALIPLSAPLIEWADVILVMGGDEHLSKVEAHPHFKARPKPIHKLEVPDRFRYRDPKLVNILKQKLADIFKV